VDERLLIPSPAYFPKKKKHVRRLRTRSDFLVARRFIPLGSTDISNGSIISAGREKNEASGKREPVAALPGNTTSAARGGNEFTRSGRRSAVDGIKSYKQRRGNAI